MLHTPCGWQNRVRPWAMYAVKWASARRPFTSRGRDALTSALRLLLQLTEENARLKRIVADLTLAKQILQKVIKKDLMPARRKAIASWMPEQF